MADSHDWSWFNGSRSKIRSRSRRFLRISCLAPDLPFRNISRNIMVCTCMCTNRMFSTQKECYVSGPSNVKPRISVPANLLGISWQIRIWGGREVMVGYEGGWLGGELQKVGKYTHNVWDPALDMCWHVPKFITDKTCLGAPGGSRILAKCGIKFVKLWAGWVSHIFTIISPVFERSRPPPTLKIRALLIQHSNC